MQEKEKLKETYDEIKEVVKDLPKDEQQKILGIAIGMTLNKTE